MKTEYANENQLQAACYSWWNTHFRRVTCLFSVPNGGTRNPKEAMNLTATGLLAGVYDLILLSPDGRVAFIELKNGPQQLRPKQKLFKARAEALGHHLYQANSLLEFQTAVCQEIGVTLIAYL